MNEFAVTLDDGRILTVFAHTEADIPEVLEAEHGIYRENIVTIRNMENEYMGKYNRGLPYLESPIWYL